MPTRWILGWGFIMSINKFVSLCWFAPFLANLAKFLARKFCGPRLQNRRNIKTYQQLECFTTLALLQMEAKAGINYLLLWRRSWLALRCSQWMFLHSRLGFQIVCCCGTSAVPNSPTTLGNLLPKGQLFHRRDRVLSIALATSFLS